MRKSKIALVVAVAVLLATMMALTVSADVVESLQNAGNQFRGGAVAIVSTVMVPAGEVIGAGVLIWLGMSLFGKHRSGEDYKPQVVGIVITVAIMFLLGVFPAWGPMLFE